jgi:hypothetical protein
MTPTGWSLIVIGNAVGFLFRAGGAGDQRGVVPAAARS